MNYGELQKLYSDFKIPYEKEAQYYIDLLLRNNKELQIQYQDFLALQNEYPDLVKYKFKKFDEILNYFKEKKWNLNSIDNNASILNSNYTEKDFKDYKPDKFYISIDLKEANWQSFKIAFDLELSDFETWSIDTFDLHTAIARSKPFRQYIFGNTNPKRLQRIQKGMMWVIYNSHPYKEFVVGKKSDELIFQFDDAPTMFKNIEKQLDFVSYTHNIPYHIKYSFFKIEEYKNFNEFVRIKQKYGGITFETKLEKKLMGVPGNRFFIHYKTLILNEEIEERDLYFMMDRRHLAKWLI